jgi:putative restriction endonuclease
MAVMHAPRTRHAEPLPQRAPHPERMVPASATGEPDDPRLWAIFQELDLGDDSLRIEFIAGAIVARGAATEWHERVVMWLVEHLLETSKNRGWQMVTKGTLPDLPAPARSIQPDLLIYEPVSAPHDDWDMPPSQMRLVAEVISRGSVEADRTLKPLSCARAGIDLYLYVDRFVTPVNVTVLSEPGPDGYQHQETVLAGPGGGKLALPELFGGIVLDLTTLPVP